MFNLFTTQTISVPCVLRKGVPGIIVDPMEETHDIYDATYQAIFHDRACRMPVLFTHKSDKLCVSPEQLWRAPTIRVHGFRLDLIKRRIDANRVHSMSVNSEVINRSKILGSPTSKLKRVELKRSHSWAESVSRFRKRNLSLFKKSVSSSSLKGMLWIFLLNNWSR